MYRVNLPSDELGSRRWKVQSLGHWEVAPNSHILACVVLNVKAPRWGVMARLFGKKLLHIRHAYGLTQVELAQQLSLGSYTHITKLEADQRAPSLDLVVRLAKLLKLSTDYFLRDTIAVDDQSALVIEAFLEDNSQVQVQSFGTKLRTLRLKQGWGQTDLARNLGVARRGYISNLEAGRKKPSLELIVQIADIFGTTTDALLIDELPICCLSG
jgi:transcriptional regulator with XRE-family HTH domain